jgi:TonB family protein
MKLRSTTALFVVFVIGCGSEVTPSSEEGRDPRPSVPPPVAVAPEANPPAPVLPDAALDAAVVELPDASVEVVLDAGVGDPPATPLTEVGKEKPGKAKKKKIPRIRSHHQLGCHWDNDTIRRIIRRHRSEIRFCYERQLAKKPDLEGMVSVKFTIGPLGSVTKAKIAKSTVGNEAVEQCIVKAVKRWAFPQPCDGKVVVTYPFMLTQGDL